MALLLLFENKPLKIADVAAHAISSMITFVMLMHWIFYQVGTKRCTSKYICGSRSRVYEVFYFLQYEAM
jgi:uncharacterized membrane protein